MLADGARPDPCAFWKEADQVGRIVGSYMSASLIRNELGVQQAMKPAMDEVRGFYADTG